MSNEPTITFRVSNGPPDPELGARVLAVVAAHAATSSVVAQERIDASTAAIHYANELDRADLIDRFVQVIARFADMTVMYARSTAIMIDHMDELPTTDPDPSDTWAAIRVIFEAVTGWSADPAAG